MATRERILAGSLEVFAERGLADSSMGEIARRSGVSKGLAYHYFDSKEELLASALRARLDSLLELTDRIREYEPADRLAALIDGLIAHAGERPDVFRLYLAMVLQAPAGALAEAGERLADPLQRYLGQIQSLFVELGSRDAEVDMALFRSALLGLCFRVAMGNVELPVAALRARLLEVFVGRPLPADAAR